MTSYDRYSKFRVNGQIEIVPFVEIPKKDSDKYEIYKRNKSRLDILSSKYYNDSSYGWLILQANPEAGSMEYEIKDGTVLRIPYPLGLSIEDYENGVNTYYKLYGNE